MFTLAVYLAVFLGILFLQFSNNNGFILSIGTLRINGSETPDSRTGVRKPDLPLYISTKGITFFTDRRHPVLAFSPGGTGSALNLRSFIREDGRFTVEFDRGVTLSFFPAEVNTGAQDPENAAQNRAPDGGTPGGVQISAEIPETIAGIRLPYRLDRGVRLENTAGGLMLRSGTDFYRLDGAAFDGGPPGTTPPEISSLTVTADNPFVAYVLHDGRQEVSLAEIQADPAASEEAYAQAAEAFAAGIPALYHAAAASNSLQEELAAAYIAESAKNGTYTQAVASVPASFLSGGGRSYISSVYFNNLERNWTGWQAQNDLAVETYAGHLSAGNPELFTRRHLTGFLIANRRTEDFSRITALAEQAAAENRLTPRQAAGILELAAERSLLPDTVPAVGADTLARCEAVIRENLRYFHASGETPAALYLTGGGNTAPVLPALETADILIRCADGGAADPAWAAVGRLLAATVLHAAGDGSAVPENLPLPDPAGNRTGSAGDRTAGTVSAADIYARLYPLSSRYPHAVAVYPGYSVWTCADHVSVSSPQAGVLDITADFPAGQTHYMVVTGIPEFQRIQIYGIDFRTDPRFETYNSSGYRYHAGTGTLFLKMRHREEHETVRLFTGS